MKLKQIILGIAILGLLSIGCISLKPERAHIRPEPSTTHLSIKEKFKLNTTLGNSINFHKTTKHLLENPIYVYDDSDHFKSDVMPKSYKLLWVCVDTKCSILEIN